MSSSGLSGARRSHVPPACSMGSFYRVPAELMRTVLSFNPDSARILRAVSRGIQQNADDFLRWNAGGIATWCSGANSSLASLISKNLITISGCLESQSARIPIQFHLSILHSIRLLSIPLGECPDGILAPHEIGAFNSRIEDHYLQRVWGPIRMEIVIATPLPADLPGEDASAREIRAWMQEEANRPVLQGIATLYLDHLNLTGVPKEIGLCTGLQELSLENNMISSLPESVFQGLPALQTLSLYNNRLRWISDALFRG